MKNNFGKTQSTDAKKRTDGGAETKSIPKKKRDIFEEREYQSKKKKVLLFGGLGTAAIGIVTAFVLVLPGALSTDPLNNVNGQGTNTATTSPTAKPEPEKTYAEGDGGVDPLTQKAEFWEKDGKLYPEKMDKRLLEYYDAAEILKKNGINGSSNGSGGKNPDGTPKGGTSEDGTTPDGVIDKTNQEMGYVEYDVYSDMAIAIYSAGGLISAAQTLPSEAAGFTSDDTKIKMPDGTLNMMYSYWTAENFQAAVGLYISRLTSPEFGGWASYQFSNTNAGKTFQIKFLEDMFTDEFILANLEKPFKDWVPIYADWDSNDYGLGDKLLPGGSRWIGEVVSTDAKFNYNDENSQYIVDMELKIRYTAWDKDKNKLERTGTMNLQLVPNLDKHKKNNGFKVLINKASLKVDG